MGSASDSIDHAINDLLSDIHADGWDEAAHHAQKPHAERQGFISRPDQAQHARQTGEGREDMPYLELLFLFLLWFFVRSRFRRCV